MLTGVISPDRFRRQKPGQPRSRIVRLLLKEAGGPDRLRYNTGGC
jgi:hypothetical protein